MKYKNIFLLNFIPEGELIFRVNRSVSDPFLDSVKDTILSAVFSDASIASADIKAQRKGMKEAIAKQELMGIDSFDLPEQWNYHLDQKSADLSLTAAARFKLDKVVASINFPFLVMTGDHDPNLDSSEEIVSSSAFGELKVLENVGHGSVLQRPDLTLKKFMEWHGC